ncbi:odorant receptor 22a-like [Bradysia coprophila]|uniref:odorant receptor 22a-like n=1 Tax=Bradysia coprophila TaxID=38358 RepID=UPI00187DB048|nr:odorant receptor 22a-like [Bradysia coprophila]
MFTIKIDKTFLQIIKLFYQVGIWQSSKESRFRETGRKLFYAFFGALFPIFLATNAFLCTDRNESIFSANGAIIVSVLYVKLLYLLFKKQEILGFFNDQSVVHSIENREIYEKTSKTIRKFMSFVRPYCLAFFITAFLLVLIELPIFSARKGLPAFISLSWNDSEIIYWLAYFYVTFSIFMCISINLFTPFIWYIMLNYSIEYELLGHKCRRLGAGKKTVETRVKKQKDFGLTQRSMFAESLIVLIKAHRSLAGTIERFRSCFSTLFMGQITTSGIGICVSVYNLAFASKESIVQREMNLVLLLYGIFDILFVMYLANDITLASDRLSYCLFESNWTEQTESCKKYVLIMGEVLKQPQRLMILIYPMNLETFMTIINGAYSMFNILKNFQ